jgi:hypothetical protein
MTREEQLAARVARKKALLEKQRQDVAEDEARLRDATRQATNKRRYQVGVLAEDAGLFTWSNAELVEVFAALVKLREMESPGLAALLDEAQTVAVGVGNGVAESPTRVSAAP